MIEVGNKVRMKRYPILTGTVTFVSKEDDVVHFINNGETYRLGLDSLEVIG